MLSKRSAPWPEIDRHEFSRSVANPSVENPGADPQDADTPFCSGLLRDFVRPSAHTKRTLVPGERPNKFWAISSQFGLALTESELVSTYPGSGSTNAGLGLSRSSGGFDQSWAGVGHFWASFDYTRAGLDQCGACSRNFGLVLVRVVLPSAKFTSAWTGDSGIEHPEERTARMYTVGGLNSCHSRGLAASSLELLAMSGGPSVLLNAGGRSSPLEADTRSRPSPT